MDYFSILNLNKEPFSNSPDPDFFFQSRQHLDCLQKLELSLLLRRGLNVIIGDVGTGKTTLCRQLIRRNSAKKEIDTHLILDPFFLDATEFLTTVTKMFVGKKPPAGTHEWQMKEYIKQHLFRTGVDQKKTTILIIDEGQKIPPFCLEILREFLNYETNEFKLLQIVIFAQKEFENTIRKFPNFADRINLFHQLKPLNFRDTHLMIKYRLEKSSNSPKKLNLFTYPALWAIYRITGGYPRKIINLCHQSILSMIIQNRSRSSYFLVRTCARRVFPEQPGRKKRITAAVAAAGATVAILLFLLPSERLKTLQSQTIENLRAAFSQKENPAASVPETKTETAAVKAQLVPSDFQVRSGTDAESDPLAAKEEPPAAAEPATVQEPVKIQEPVKVEAPAKIPAPMKAAETAPTVAAAEPPAREAPEESTKADLPYSAILGRMAIKRDETLSRVIQHVYGDFNSRYFKSFILANPDIEDPDRVEVGQIVALPAISVAVKPPQTPVWWVKIGESDSLEAAYNILRENNDSPLPMRLISFWEPQAGNRFAVVIKKLFRDEQTARNELARMPAELSFNGTVATLWNENTVYFADPYFGLKH